MEDADATTTENVQRNLQKGNVQKALDAAIQAALQSAQGADRMVQWTLKVISGRRGGIAGFNEVTVAIRARVS